MTLVLAAVGCGEVGVQTTSVPLDQVPPNVMSVAREKAPAGLKFESARKFTMNDEEVYEVRGKNSRGKIVEVEVSASGKFIEIE
jgi:hypothetical protein